MKTLGIKLKMYIILSRLVSEHKVIESGVMESLAGRKKSNKFNISLTHRPLVRTSKTNSACPSDI